MCFTTAPILGHFDSSIHTVVETGESDYAIAGLLSQFLELAFKKLKNPVALNIHKLMSAEVN